MLPEIEPDIQEKLDLYLDLLEKWQKSINLVSNSTMYEAWKRHFMDSLQLESHIPHGAEMFDIGSGAGFPGLVLAVARPDLKVTLIDSDQKKCTFLSTVSRETNTPVTVIDKRIESAPLHSIPAIVTARALAPLDKLLAYCLPWATRNPGLKMLFLKGEGAGNEVAAAQEHYNFDLEILPSETSPEGAILKVTNLSGKSVN